MAQSIATHCAVCALGWQLPDCRRHVDHVTPIVTNRLLEKSQGSFDIVTDIDAPNALFLIRMQSVNVGNQPRASYAAQAHVSHTHVPCSTRSRQRRYRASSKVTRSQLGDAASGVSSENQHHAAQPIWEPSRRGLLFGGATLASSAVLQPAVLPRQAQASSGGNEYITSVHPSNIQT